GGLGCPLRTRCIHGGEDLAALPKVRFTRREDFLVEEEPARERNLPDSVPFPVRWTRSSILCLHDRNRARRGGRRQRRAQRRDSQYGGRRNLSLRERGAEEDLPSRDNIR